MKKVILFLFFLFFVFPLFCQNHDNIWYFGYSGEVDDPLDTIYGITVLDFSMNEVEKYQEDYAFIDFDALDVTMSDSLGNFLFAFNGYAIEDASLSIMQNGDNFNNETYDPGDGYRLPQGGIALPFPGHPDEYVLFHATKATIEEPDWGPKIVELYYSVIDMQENGGLGAVVQKNKLIVNDTLSYGFMTATKHANGRDWWVLINKSPDNKFYKILLDETGVQIYDIQAIGDTLFRGLGQAVFSPDGGKYIQYKGVSTSIGYYLYVYDFDRCTGELNNPQIVHRLGNEYSMGAAVSPNSRYLYTPSDFYILQYDLWTDDIASSLDTVAIYDGFGDPFGTRFFLAQLAPDGKIYISANNSTNYLSIIHEPNEGGEACMVEQHGLRLPTRNFVSIPNNPNYRLGPLDSNPCDTLGFDNNPIAKYRYWQDTLDILSLTFTDLSYYEPTDWSWDFGDGETSTEVDPVHVFPGNGVYEVCLTVSNENSSHTICHTLYLGVTATGEPAPLVEVMVYPNPVRDYFMLQYSASQRVEAVLFDALGRPLQRKKLVLGNERQLEWDVGDLASGVYYLQGFVEGESVFAEKVVVL